MSSAIATVAYIVLVLGLFWLDRNPKVRTSSALWIPVVWLLLASSRSVAQWLTTGQQVGPMPSADQYAMEGSLIDRIVYTGLLVIGLILLINRRKQVGRILQANGPVLVFFGYCAVSLLWSDYPDVAFKRWTKALGDLVMVLVVVSDREPYAAVKRLLSRLTFLLIPFSVLFIKYYPELGKGYGRWDYKSIYTGVTTNKNSLGVICLFLGAASLWRFLAAYHEPRSAPRSRQLLAHGIILAMVFWLFWMANSMTSLSCFLLAAIVMIAASSRAVFRRPAIVPILITAILLVSVVVLLLGLDPGILRTMGRDPTLTDRTEIWSTILASAGNPWVGTGFESFWLGPRLQKIWSSFSWQPFEAHNGYIEIYLNLGWTGIALLALVLATGYRTVMAAWRRQHPASSLMLAYFVIALIYNFTEAAFFRMMAPAWIFLLLAITAIPQRLPPATRKFLHHLPPAQDRAEVAASAAVAAEEFV
jgi:exopolysaccharide production protein ExoQ